ncbi:transcriptional regulator [Lelliottia amnigena]|uniref:transcriptional regulator n=1 Tax=Lelliottia amnigena TaxID=61646 RepID=UPI0040566281
MENELLSWRRASTKEEWQALAVKSGTSTGYLNLIAYGYRNASPKLATSIEAASRTFVGKKTLKREMLVFPHPGNGV